MTDGDAIHAKILTEPDEDVHRLAYADWLDEQGEHARAEFIRVQCELAREPEFVKVVGPDRRINRTSVEKGGEWWEVNPEYKRLCDRRNELLARHAYHWLPEVPGLRRYAVGRNFGPDYVAVGYHTDAPLADGDRIIPLPPPIRVEFRRGFVERVTCAGDDWARHGDAILAAHPVRRVTLTTWPAFADNRYRQRGIPAVVRQNLRILWPRVEFVLPDPAPDIPDHPDYATVSVGPDVPIQFVSDPGD